MKKMIINITYKSDFECYDYMKLILRGKWFMNNTINVIYWSVTGNTELMAQSIYEGSSKNENVRLISVDKANIDDVKEADILFLGCPSMGNEVLEETEMEPFMKSISNNIKDKKIVLFGSYGWEMENGCKIGKRE